MRADVTLEQLLGGEAGRAVREETVVRAGTQVLLHVTFQPYDRLGHAAIHLQL